MIPPELIILLNAIRADILGFDSSVVGDLDDNFNQDLLLELATYHGLIWQVASFCKQTKLLEMPYQNRLQQLVMFETARAMTLEKESLSIASALQKNNIEFAIFKGIAANYQFTNPQQKSQNYGLRNSVDIDILVSKKHLSSAIKLLLNIGYKAKQDNSLLLAEFISQYPHWSKYRDVGFIGAADLSKDIDLHWQVAHTFSLPLNTADLLQRIEHVEVEHQTFPTLSFNDHFLLICVHGYLDQFFILKYLVDIYRAMNHPDFQQQEILKYADQYGVRKVVDESIATARYFFADMLSAEVLDSQSPYVKNVYQSFLHNSMKPSRYRQPAGQWHLLDKWRYIMHQLKTRSARSSWWSPILHHLKYDFSMMISKPKAVNPLIWWPLARLLKLFKVNK